MYSIPNSNQKLGSVNGGNKLVSGSLGVISEKTFETSGNHTVKNDDQTSSKKTLEQDITVNYDDS